PHCFPHPHSGSHTRRCKKSTATCVSLLCSALLALFFSLLLASLLLASAFPFAFHKLRI
ncbi:hypothetical protein GQ54DRAFT_299996, partial [Martensiomyces pterosporus]